MNRRPHRGIFSRHRDAWLSSVLDLYPKGDNRDWRFDLEEVRQTLETAHEVVREVATSVVAEEQRWRGKFSLTKRIRFLIRRFRVARLVVEHPG